jgi:hypothetical protein
MEEGIEEGVSRKARTVKEEGASYKRLASFLVRDSSGLANELECAVRPQGLARAAQLQAAAQLDEKHDWTASSFDVPLAWV